MEDWNDTDSSVHRNKPEKGPLYFPLTVLALVLVGGLSMLMAKLTADVPNRPIWMMGLMFMVPAGAMFFAALLVEFSTGAMTPNYNRSAQVKVAIAATLLSFLAGCICDGIYLMGGFSNQAKANVIFVLDNTGSMYLNQASDNKTRNEITVEAMDAMLGMMSDDMYVGLIHFDSNYCDEVPMAPLDEQQRSCISQEVDSMRNNNGATFFETPLNAAITMAESLNNGRATRIVLLTDGVEGASDSYSKSKLLISGNKIERMAERCAKTHVNIYSLSMFSSIDEGLSSLVQATGGSCVSTDKAEDVLDFLQTASHVDGDMVRADTPTANILTAVMLLLEGLVIGAGLSLMLSVQGQFRVQLILSPIMGVLAALLLKVIKPPFPEQWMLEGVSMALLGLVLMRRNQQLTASKTPQFSENIDSQPDTNFDW